MPGEVLLEKNSQNITTIAKPDKNTGFLAVGQCLWRVVRVSLQALRGNYGLGGSAGTWVSGLDSFVMSLPL